MILYINYLKNMLTIRKLLLTDKFKENNAYLTTILISHIK